MRSTQFLWLGISFLAGIVWVFIAQSWVFLNFFSALLGQDMNVFLTEVSSPSFTFLWFSCIAALALWIFITASSKPRNGAEVRKMQPLWWIGTSILVLLGWIYQWLFSTVIWQIQQISPVQGSGVNYYPLPASGWLLLMVFVVFDVTLLFWLPTLLASPRTYRFVVPGAVRLLGGR